MMKPALMVLALAVLCLITTTSHATDIKKADIAGLRIGMTEEEATKAIIAHNKALNPVPHHYNFPYSDGAVQHTTPDVLKVIQATRNPGTDPTQRDIETIGLAFDGDVKTPRVVAIRRENSGIQNPTSRAAFIQALKDKYGEPTNVAGNRLVWHLGGPQKECTDISAHIANASNHGEAMSMLQNNLSVIGEDISSCGSYLSYNLVGDPATGMQAFLYDAQALAKGVAQLDEWIDGLEAEAVKKLQDNAQAPKL